MDNTRQYEHTGNICILKTARGYELFKKERSTPDGGVFTALSGGRVELFSRDYLERYSITMEKLDEHICAAEEHMGAGEEEYAEKE
jgi:hypothetical protein